MSAFTQISTGVIGLDKLLNGGLPAGRVYLVSGPPGSGKSTLGVHFLEDGAKRGENGLYIVTLEHPRNIIDDMTNIFPSLPQHIKERRINFADMGWSLESHYDGVGKSDKIATPLNFANKIQDLVKKSDTKRLVLDSSAVIKNVSSDEKVQKYELSRFIRKLKDMGCTTIILSEMTEPDNYTVEQFLVHGVIFMHNFLKGAKMVRGVQIMKMGGVYHSCDIKRMILTDKGIEVFDEKVL